MKSLLNTNGTNINSKIVIIGAGYVGSSIAYALNYSKVVKEVALIDINDKKVEAEALDINHGISSLESPSIYVGSYKDIQDCNLVIVTAGRNRKPFETRFELYDNNKETLQNIFDQVAPYYKYCPIVIVTNPVDLLVYHFSKQLRLTNGLLFGSGCILDSSRFIVQIAQQLNLKKITGIRAYVIGVHGEKQVPVWSNATINGEKLNDFCDKHHLNLDREAITLKLLKMGSTIIQGKGRTHFGIASCMLNLIDAIFSNEQCVFTVSSYLSNYQGFGDIALSIPSLVGRNGIIKKVPTTLDRSDAEALRKSAEFMAEEIQKHKKD